MNTNGYGMEVFHRTIQGFKNHPNFSHVFVVGLGCECAQISLFQNQESNNVIYLNIQDEGGTKSIVNKCFDMICDVLPDANKFNRSTQSINKLSLALQCGGSDSYSGNRALGSNLLTLFFNSVFFFSIKKTGILLLSKSLLEILIILSKGHSFFL